jgi:uncharacterized membrane protein YedE/YeeE
MKEPQSKRNARLESIAHYMTAIVVFMKGLDKIDRPGKLLYAIIFMVIGVLIVLGTVFHHRFERHLRHFKGFVLIFEAIVMAIVGYLYMKDGKQYIQYACFLTSIGFIIATIIYFTRPKSAAHH